MPTTRKVTKNKGRSRTGCIPCRKRRRKCDERKPQCQSCEARNVTCSYNDWTFVLEPSSFARSPKLAGDVGQEVHTHGSHPRHSPEPLQPNSGLLPTPLSTDADTAPESHLQDGDHSLVVYAFSPGDSEDLHLTTPLSRPSTTNSDNIIKPSDRPPFPTGAALLSHFRWKTASWMDSSAPRSSFVLHLLELSRNCVPLQKAIATVVASHANCAEQVDLGTWTEKHLRSSRDNDLPSTLEDPMVKDVTYSLLALKTFFGSPPSAWREVTNLAPECCWQPLALKDFPQPLRILVRLHRKIDLAVGLLMNESPLVRPPDFTISPYIDGDSSLQGAYDCALVQLASALSLSHPKPPRLSVRSRETEVATDAKSSSAKLTHWSTLWTICVDWYQSRPATMSPMFLTPSLLPQSPEVTEEAAPAFQTELYTTPVVLQEKIIMHLVFSLILAHKPRLLKLAAPPERKLMSKSWHAQKIAAIALSNHFEEQWDPIMVAGLLRVAKEMTHPLQQDALLKCLRQISTTVGIDLQVEIKNLEAHWATFRHNL